MPFDIVAWLETQTATALSGVAAVADPQYAVSGDTVTVKKDKSFLAGVLQIGVSTPKICEFRQPSLNIPYRFTKSAIATVVDHRAGFTNLLKRPLPLYPNEKLSAFVQNATAEYSVIVAWLSSGYIDPQPVNPTHILTSDIDSTLTVNIWNSVTPTYDQDLPKGTYEVLGMKVGSYVATSNPLVTRLVCPDSPHRVGVITNEMTADKTLNVNAKNDVETVWNAMKGVEFEHDRPPTLEMLSLTADTDHVLELTLRKK